MCKPHEICLSAVFQSFHVDELKAYLGWVCRRQIQTCSHLAWKCEAKAYPPLLLILVPRMLSKSLQEGGQRPFAKLNSLCSLHSQKATLVKQYDTYGKLACTEIPSFDYLYTWLTVECTKRVETARMYQVLSS